VVVYSKHGCKAIEELPILVVCSAYDKTVPRRRP